jgi:hypothetical protein
MNIPAATAGAIDAVRTSDHFIVLPAITVKLFPLPGLWGNHVFNPTH